MFQHGIVIVNQQSAGIRPQKLAPLNQREALLDGVGASTSDSSMAPLQNRGYLLRQGSTEQNRGHMRQPPRVPGTFNAQLNNSRATDTVNIVLQRNGDTQRQMEQLQASRHAVLYTEPGEVGYGVRSDTMVDVL